MQSYTVHGIKNWKEDNRLKFSGLTRLDKRTIRSDFLETLKILNGFYTINKGLLLDLDDSGRSGGDPGGPGGQRTPHFPEWGVTYKAVTPRF